MKWSLAGILNYCLDRFIQLEKIRPGANFLEVIAFGAFVNRCTGIECIVPKY